MMNLKTEEIKVIAELPYSWEKIKDKLFVYFRDRYYEKFESSKSKLEPQFSFKDNILFLNKKSLYFNAYLYSFISSIDDNDNPIIDTLTDVNFLRKRNNFFRDVFQKINELEINIDDIDGYSFDFKNDTTISLLMDSFNSTFISSKNKDLNYLQENIYLKIENEHGIANIVLNRIINNYKYTGELEMSICFNTNYFDDNVGFLNFIGDI